MSARTDEEYIDDSVLGYKRLLHYALLTRVFSKLRETFPDTYPRELSVYQHGGGFEVMKVVASDGTVLHEGVSGRVKAPIHTDVSLLLSLRAYQFKYDSAGDVVFTLPLHPKDPNYVTSL